MAKISKKAKAFQRVKRHASFEQELSKDKIVQQKKRKSFEQSETVQDSSAEEEEVRGRITVDSLG
jgi:hypothetical protein